MAASLFTYSLFSKNGLFSVYRPKLDPFKEDVFKRKWMKVESERSLSLNKDLKEAFTIQVVSYNVLAEKYTKGCFHLGTYKLADLDVVQDFEYRATRVIRELQDDFHNESGDINYELPGVADVICL
jgi:hypothetical protein